MVSKTYRLRVQRAANLFKLVSSPTRALILATLVKHKRCSVQVLATEINMTHSAVSHQLALMQRSKLVERVKEGRNAHYSAGASKEAKALTRFLASLLVR